MKKRYSPEQIVGKLRQADVELARKAREAERLAADASLPVRTRIAAVSLLLRVHRMDRARLAELRRRRAKLRAEESAQLPD